MNKIAKIKPLDASNYVAGCDCISGDAPSIVVMDVRTQEVVYCGSFANSQRAFDDKVQEIRSLGIKILQEINNKQLGI